MTATDLVDRLAEHKTIGGAPREELAWLAAHGSLRHLEQGEVLSAKGAPVAGLFVLLAGHVAIYVDRGTGRHKVMEWRGGDVGGVLPYSRLVSPPADSVAQEPTEILAIRRDDLGAMIRECHEITSILVHKMLDRSRAFLSSGLQDEKMLSLGKLSAGVAHELNNPVSAIARGAAVLDDRLNEAERAAQALSAASLTATQLDAIETILASCRSARPNAGLTPIQRAEREDSLADWLAAHGVETDIAEHLAETGLTLDVLDRVAPALDGPALAPALRSVAAGCAVREITSEIQEGARRISGLVAAIKGFTHMDQAVVAEPVDLRSSLSHTVTVLAAKAHLKRVTLTVDVEPGLPRVRGFAGELNQIWANLLDNAIDAVPDSGTVTVTATRDRQLVVVRVVDNGPGIPADVRPRIFEPFFTTKPVGKGTGLGLDIVQRLVTHNDAGIDVETVPGRTEFRVSLPIAD